MQRPALARPPAAAPAAPRRGRRPDTRRAALSASMWDAFDPPPPNTVRVIQEDAPASDSLAPSSSSCGRRVVADARVAATADKVWAILTNYAALPSIVPNLEACEVVPGASNPGAVRVRQRAVSQCRWWRIEAEALLEVTPSTTPAGARVLSFDLVEGDFRSLAGRWVVTPIEGAGGGPSLACALRYELVAVPAWRLPPALVSAVVAAGLPVNVRAVAAAAEAAEAAAAGARTPLDAVDAAVPEGASLLAPRAPTDATPPLPAKGPPRMQQAPWPAVRAALAGGAVGGGQPPARRRGRGAAAYLGVASVPLPAAAAAAPPPPLPPPPPTPAARAAAADALAATYPAFTEPVASTVGAIDGSPATPQGVTVHLRRLDPRAGGLHRRALAEVTVAAPPADVWAVLTDYERLPSVVPSLAACDVIARDEDSKRARVRQVAYRRLQYVELHAESVLDVAEVEARGELQFRQVAGDADDVRGKWMVEGVGGGGGGGDDSTTPQHTHSLLRYAVEVKVSSPSPALAFLEPLLEAVVAEDVPRGVAAVAAAAEARAAAGAAAAAAPPRPRLADLADDFGLLAAELAREFGVDGGGEMPTRAALRAAGRSDLEKAVAAHGGPAAVADRLGWRLPYKERKPAGYWDDDATLRAELAAFVAEAGLPPRTMPSKADMVRAGRHDMARAVERRGGLYAVAAATGYAMPTRAGAAEWAAHVSAVAAETGLSGTNGLFEAAAASYRRSGAQRANKVEEESSAVDDGSAATSGDLLFAGAGGPALPQKAKRGATAATDKAGAAAPRTLRDEIDAW